MAHAPKGDSLSWPILVILIHLLAAMTWVGGMIFLALVVVPASRHLEPSLRANVLRAVGRRFRVVGWGALAVLIVTGFLNAARYGYEPAELLTGGWMTSRFGRMLTAKLALALVMGGLTLAHDLVGQRVNTLAEGPEGAAAPALVRLSAWLIRLNLLVALVVVALAVVLLRPIG